MSVHPTAIVHEGAVLGEGVEVGAYAIVGPRVRLGDGVQVRAHAVVEGNTEVGEGTIVYPTAVVGGPPQDLKYRGEDSRLLVGKRNHIREGATVNIGTEHGGGITRVGDDCMLMACAHVAHDCQVGDRVILANNVMLAGHVRVMDSAILNGGVGVHHFTTVGRFAYVGGLSRITKDVPPFHTVEGHPSRVRGVNVIGLKRAGMSDEAIQAVKEAHKRIYRSDMNIRDAIAELRVEYPDVAEIRELTDFLEASGGGRQGRQGENPGRGVG